MVRRAALLMFVAFMAGSSVNWPCLFECTAADPVATEAACHHGTPDQPRLTTGDDCSGERPQITPFVRTDGFTVAMAVASPGTLVSRLVPRRSGQPSVVAFDVDPPGSQAVIPLRI